MVVTNLYFKSSRTSALNLADCESKIMIFCILFILYYSSKIVRFHLSISNSIQNIYYAEYCGGSFVLVDSVFRSAAGGHFVSAEVALWGPRVTLLTIKGITSL